MLEEKYNKIKMKLTDVAAPGAVASAAASCLTTVYAVVSREVATEAVPGAAACASISL